MILLEFNELTPALMDRFIDEGKLPNFKRFRDESHVYTTDADASGEALNPWVQWVSVHTGLGADEHGLVHLDEGHRLRVKRIWDLVNEAGLPVWVCGSMNAGCAGAVNGGVLPDPWTSALPPHPPELQPYYRFIKVNVQEHTRDADPTGWFDKARFLAFMATHGLSARTVWEILAQTVRGLRGRRRWQRVAIMDRLQWDLFRWYYARFKPAFATFFLNSTAHLQHTYWRSLAPEAFTVKPSPDARRDDGDAILFGYRTMDELLGRFMRLAGADTTLIFCTGLSQQPCTLYDAEGGKRFYRPRAFERLLAFAGVTAPHSVAPVMSEQYHVRFESDADAERAERALGALRAGAQRVLSVERKGAALFAGCAIFRQLEPDARITAEAGGATGRFFDLFYQADAVKSGMHHPDGMLWIRTPDKRHSEHPAKVPLVAVAPTILNLLSIPRPAYMRAAPLLP